VLQRESFAMADDPSARPPSRDDDPPEPPPRRRRELDLDAALDMTFPASDPIAIGSGRG
jgi:hypothetical protein